MIDFFSFLAVIFTALALVPAGGHLFEMRAKFRFSAEHYYIVQNIYRGWGAFGYVLVGAVLANAVVAVLRHGSGRALWLSIAATFLVALNLPIFFRWTHPANTATENWTRVLPDWEALRAQWEYSHGANAVLLFIALCLATAAAML